MPQIVVGGGIGDAELLDTDVQSVLKINVYLGIGLTFTASTVMLSVGSSSPTR